MAIQGVETQSIPTKLRNSKLSNTRSATTGRDRNCVSMQSTGTRIVVIQNTRMQTVDQECEDLGNRENPTTPGAIISNNKQVIRNLKYYTTSRKIRLSDVQCSNKEEGERNITNKTALEIIRTCCNEANYRNIRNPEKNTLKQMTTRHGK